MEVMKMGAVNPELKVYSQNEKTPININNDYTGLQKDVRELERQANRSASSRLQDNEVQ